VVDRDFSLRKSEGNSRNYVKAVPSITDERFLAEEFGDPFDESDLLEESVGK
jgi:hypothetical protein